MSSLSVESDWQPRKRGSIFSRGKKIVFNSKGPPSLLFNGYQQFFLKDKVGQAKAEGDQSRPYKTEVKNEWSYVSTLPYAFMPADRRCCLSPCSSSVAEILQSTVKLQKKCINKRR